MSVRNINCSLERNGRLRLTMETVLVYNSYLFTCVFFKIINTLDISTVCFVS